MKALKILILATEKILEFRIQNLKILVHKKINSLIFVPIFEENAKELGIVSFTVFLMYSILS